MRVIINASVADPRPGRHPAIQIAIGIEDVESVEKARLIASKILPKAEIVAIGEQSSPKDIPETVKA